jgi:hypothetical protein
MHPNFRYKPNPDGVYEEYLNQISLFRTLLKHRDSSVQDNKELLDGHKVAACITAAITKVRIITSGAIEDKHGGLSNLDSSNRMNEQAAVMSGLSCLYEYMLADETNLISPESGTFRAVFPQTTYKSDPKREYLESLIRALYYTNVTSSVNPLLLAHVFFFIEVYHRQSVELMKLKLASQ